MLPPKNASGMPVVPKNLDNRDLELFLQNVRQVLTGQKSAGGKGSDIYLEPAVKRYFDEQVDAKLAKLDADLRAYVDAKTRTTPP